MCFLILGWSVGKEKKSQKNLELGCLVPQHNIRGAWKQQDKATKSAWQHWGKERSMCMNSKKKDVKTLTVLQIKVTMF